MKLKLLLFLFLATFSGVLIAQEANRSVIFTEIRNHANWNSHVEITNMGDTPVDLSEFVMGRKLRVCDVFSTEAWGTGRDNRDVRTFLPQVTLNPGESYVVAAVVDFVHEKYQEGDRQLGIERQTQIEMYDEADWQLYHPESGGDETDSVTWDYSYEYPDIHNVIGWPRHGAGLFLEHHFAEGDSAVVDQVLGVFDQSTCSNGNQGHDVAGVYKATTNTLIVRKASIKTGNMEFVRGLSAEDSEWMVFTYPPGYDAYRTLWWTVGNHGSYKLDANTLKSFEINVDYPGKKITVPWGTRRLDGVMKKLIKTEGLVWEYQLNANRADSLLRTAQNGDKIQIWVTGDEVQTATFDIMVAEPLAEANMVVPIAHKDAGSIAEGGPVTWGTQSGILSWPRVTENESGMDTITGSWFGLPSALRADTLLAYLEKPSNASWEIETVDGVERPDLKNGDKLKVTSESGDVKEYFIQVQPFNPTSRNNYLSAITWPDIPEYMKGYFGWTGDTIPGFDPTAYNYVVEIPMDVPGIPALIATTDNANATIEVVRAKTLSGTPEDRTAQFIITSPNGEKRTYNVEFSKQKDPANVQPNLADPFISEYIFKDQTLNNFMEIVNPGNQILDLSNYMIVSNATKDPGSAITKTETDTWKRRYSKYIPGYKWGNETEWAVAPEILKPDVNVNPLVMPGDVFVIGLVWGDSKMSGGWAPWKALGEVDVFLNSWDLTHNDDVENPWGELTLWDGTGSSWDRWRGSCVGDISGSAHMYIFEILNDSIKAGLKQANDPKDFRLIEAWGMADGSKWNIAGSTIPKKYNTFKRKPEIYKGNDVLQASFGTNAEDSEWTHDDEVSLWEKGLQYRNNTDNIGQHFMNEATYYKSTVNSLVYIVSGGYKLESIKGVTTGTTVGVFLDNIIKADEGQSLSVLSVSTGDVVGDAQAVSLNDTLLVYSADSTNTTKYVLDVTEAGLSSDALLTSDTYEIAVADDTVGSISGVTYETTVADVVANVTVPAGASMSIINANGASVSLQVLNNDTVYVDQMVSQDILLEVMAEDGKTIITYQLKPTSLESDAKIYSTLYGVSETNMVVQYVRRGTYVSSFWANTTLSVGATAKIVDNMGNERTEGGINDDDKVVVTSADGSVTNTYYISLQASTYGHVTYLAYALSAEYHVDQVDYVISGPHTDDMVSKFLGNTSPCYGATLAVIDAEGNVKTSGDLDTGDMLEVTSGDGALVVYYSIDLDMTAAHKFGVQQIEIYPNPTSGVLNIRGMEVGNRIQVYSSTGSVLRDIDAKSSIERLSLDDLPSGMFVIVVSNDNEKVATFKAIRK